MPEDYTELEISFGAEGPDFAISIKDGADVMPEYIFIAIHRISIAFADQYGVNIPETLQEYTNITVPIMDTKGVENGN